MKKYLIPAIVLLSLLVGIIVFFVIMGYEKVQYSNTISANMTHVSEESGELIAVYMGQKTQVVGQNLRTIKNALTVYQRNIIFRKPKYDAESAIYLSFSDGAEIIIVPDESVDDGVFIFYTYQNKNLRISIKNYRTIELLTNAISPEGIYNKNIIVG